MFDFFGDWLNWVNANDDGSPLIWLGLVVASLLAAFVVITVVFAVIVVGLTAPFTAWEKRKRPERHAASRAAFERHMAEQAEKKAARRSLG
jgi:NhaP-type Na+/H+ or K+/H+ antiporter